MKIKTNTNFEDWLDEITKIDTNGIPIEILNIVSLLPRKYKKVFNFLKLKYTFFVDWENFWFISIKWKKVIMNGLNEKNFKKLIFYYLFKELFNSNNWDKKDKIINLVLLLKNKNEK